MPTFLEGDQHQKPKTGRLDDAHDGIERCVMCVEEGSQHPGTGMIKCFSRRGIFGAIVHGSLLNELNGVLSGSVYNTDGLYCGIEPHGILPGL